MDKSSDFIILKLDRKLPIIHYKFNTDSVAINDIVYSNKTILKNSTVAANEIDYSKIEFTRDMNGCKFIAFLGTSGNGASGSPIFNSKAELIGIIDFGWNIVPGLPKNIISEIENGFKLGYQLGGAFSIKYLLNKYMKGYLN